MYMLYVRRTGNSAVSGPKTNRIYDELCSIRACNSRWVRCVCVYTALCSSHSVCVNIKRAQISASSRSEKREEKKNLDT